MQSILHISAPILSNSNDQQNKALLLELQFKDEELKRVKKENERLKTSLKECELTLKSFREQLKTEKENAKLKEMEVPYAVRYIIIQIFHNKNLSFVQNRRF